MDRRSFAGRVAAGAMIGGLAAGYGGMGLVAARYLFPARPQQRRWMFVAELTRLKPGDSILYTAPNGARINIARQGNQGRVEDFIALSSVCPHLGCQVHWEGQNKRFFCPCHNGIFDPAGKGIGGPPGEAGQNLPRYPLKIENGLLMIEVPVEKLG
jgi:Rieske Fe-S protein